MKIKGKEYALRYSIRMFMLFETMTGRTFRGGLTDNVTLFYCALPSDAFTLDELIDTIDEEPNILDEFCEWLNKEATKQSERAGRKGKDKKDKKKA